MPLRNTRPLSLSGLLPPFLRRFPADWLRIALLPFVAAVAVFTMAARALAAESATPNPAPTPNRHGPVEARAGGLTGSIQLSKAQFQLGEPVRLLINLSAGPNQGVVLPKASDWEMVRVVGADADQNPIPYTPAGEWLSTLPAPDNLGIRHLYPGRSRSFDVDLAEIFQLDKPGDKSIIVNLRFFNFDSRGAFKSLTFPVLHFTLLSTRAPAAPAREKSFFLTGYDEIQARAAGRPRQLTPLEEELVRENERVMREHLAAEAVRLRTNPPSNDSLPPANAASGKPTPGTVATPPVSTKTDAGASEAPKHPLRFAPIAGLAAAVAAAVVIVVIRARTRSGTING